MVKNMMPYYLSRMGLHFNYRDTPVCNWIIDMDLNPYQLLCYSHFSFGPPIVEGIQFTLNLALPLSDGMNSPRLSMTKPPGMLSWQVCWFLQELPFTLVMRD